MRTVRHVLFTSWPNYGVVDDVTRLTQLVKRVIRAVRYRNSVLCVIRILIKCKLFSRMQIYFGSKISVADLDPGFGAFWTPGSGMGKKSRSGSQMKIPDHISEIFETIFWVKILKCGSGYGIWESF
jgi:hypothetical protein